MEMSLLRSLEGFGVVVLQICPFDKLRASSPDGLPEKD